MSYHNQSTHLLNSNQAENLLKLKPAIVYDHLVTKHGGAELVLKSLFKLFPEAHLFTSIANLDHFDWLNKQQVTTTWLQSIPWLKKYFRLTAPLSPLAFESLDLSRYQLIISVTAGAAKGVLTSPNQLHICYQLTPPRYIYDTPAGYIQSESILGYPPLKWLIKPVKEYLRWWDQVAAHRPDEVIAISKLVAQRIKKNYDQSSRVIYPPFIPLPPVSSAANSLPLQNYLLVVSRLVNYKRFDLAISAAVALRKFLIIAGEGPAKNNLIKQAAENAIQRAAGQSLQELIKQAKQDSKYIIFTNAINEQEKSKLIHQASAVLMPGLEDFGIAGLEAASVGTPVICHHQSGIAEVLENNKTAIHLEKPSSQELAEAISRIDRLKISKKQQQFLKNKYSENMFLDTFANTTYKIWSNHSTI